MKSTFGSGCHLSGRYIQATSQGQDNLGQRTGDSAQLWLSTGHLVYLVLCNPLAPAASSQRGCCFDQRQTALLQQGAVTSPAQVRQLLLSQAAGESRAAGQRCSGQKEMEPDPCTWALQPLNKQPVPEAGLFQSCSAPCRAVPALLLAGIILCHILLPTLSLAKAAFTPPCLIEGPAPVQLLFSIRKEWGLSGPFWLCQGPIMSQMFPWKDSLLTTLPPTAIQSIQQAWYHYLQKEDSEQQGPHSQVWEIKDEISQQQRTGRDQTAAGLVQAGLAACRH